MELGGDGIYAAWQLSYLEPVLRGRTLQSQRLEAGLCPVAESLQGKLLLFKCNYTDLRQAQEKAEALAKTIAFFWGG